MEGFILISLPSVSHSTDSLLDLYQCLRVGLKCSGCSSALLLPVQTQKIGPSLWTDLWQLFAELFGINSCDPGNQQSLCRHLFRKNICYETLQLLPVLNRWALLRLMIVKYELYNVSEQPTAMLLQHIQCWHLFIYSQSALKAALTSKLWGLYISASLGCKNRKYMNTSLSGSDYNQTDNLIWARMAHGYGWQKFLMSVKTAVHAGAWRCSPSNS